MVSSSFKHFSFYIQCSFLSEIMIEMCISWYIRWAWSSMDFFVLTLFYITLNCITIILSTAVVFWYLAHKHLFVPIQAYILLVYIMCFVCLALVKFWIWSFILFYCKSCEDIRTCMKYIFTYTRNFNHNIGDIWVVQQNWFLP